MITAAKAARRWHHNRIQNPPYNPQIHRTRLQGLKVATLKELAKKNGLSLTSKATKSEIIDALIVCKVRGPIS